MLVDRSRLADQLEAAVAAARGSAGDDPGLATLLHRVAGELDGVERALIRQEVYELLRALAPDDPRRGPWEAVYPELFSAASATGDRVEIGEADMALLGAAAA